MDNLEKIKEYRICPDDQSCSSLGYFYASPASFSKGYEFSIFKNKSQ